MTTNDNGERHPLGTAWRTVARALTKLNAASFALALSTSLLLPLLTAPIVAHATGGITNTRGDAWGTLEVAGTDSSNLGGAGVDIFSNGAQVSYTPDKPNNTVNGVVSGEEWQCVELVNRLYLTKGWTSATWSGNGGQLYDTAPTALNKELNGSITYLNPGDVLVLQDSGAGHAAIINTFNGSTGAMQIESQNTNAVFDSTFSLSNKTISSTGWGTYSVKGVVHHPTTRAKKTTLGVFDPSSNTFYLRNSNTAGVADLTYIYGNAGWTPIVGDWDGNRTTTAGVFDASTNTFYLRNSNTAGSADLTVQYGNAGWTPIVGDWDGNGTTTLGVFDPSSNTFYLRNSNTAGVADLTVPYGNSGWLPIVGDWDGNGTTTLGVYDPSTSTFYLRNSNTAGVADLTFVYGNANAGWLPIAGDWDGNGTVTIGLFDPSSNTFYLRNSNTAGVADLTVQYGNAGWKPIVGDWTGQ